MADVIAAIILAAGLSRRMGTPKMLLPWGESSVLGQVVATFARVNPREILIVTGGSRDLVVAEAERLSSRFPVRCIHNPGFETGDMLASLQRGLESQADDVEAVLIGLGDQPQLSQAALQAVAAAAYAAGSSRLIVPSCGMRRGHPWLVQRDLWAEILALSPPLTLRDFLSAHADEILYIEADQTILKDLDTLEEYQREKP